MPQRTRLRWIGALALVGAFLAVPASSQATLVFTRNPTSPTIFAAKDNGSGVHRIGPGSIPRISPDGEGLVFYRQQGRRAELMYSSIQGDTPRKLLGNWEETFVFAWSPDSSSVAVVAGPEVGKKRLVLVDVASGAQRTLASGFFGGVSFSPDGSEIAYSRAGSENYPPKTDVYRVPTAGGKAVQLTSDGRSLNPLWGPSGQIVFVKLLGAKQRKYGPKNDLYLMNQNGGQVKRLTNTKVDPLVQGLSPTAWSANGRRLLAEFGGQDTSYAVTVNPQTGAERTLTSEREVGFIGTALSADGSTVLGSLGGFEPGPGHKVVTIPYGGGKPKTLVNNASEPDWSRLSPAVRPGAGSRRCRSRRPCA